MRLLILNAVVGFIVLTMLPAGVYANPMGGSENSVDRPGGDFHQFNAGNVSICSTSCATDPNCKTYTYATATGICWMKNTVPKRKNSNCCVSGAKVMGAQEINADRPGGNIKPGFPAVTSSQCEGFCKSDLKCRSYTWVKPGVQANSGMCWLKNKRPGKAANLCCISGIRLRDPVRITVPSNNLKLKK
ncbi:MAG: hypothetical protein GY789_23650 [Hyphomicrobiales bacterium]|nr:hypothetical protein [Hyphomicrobiales bacterium]MCP4997758.1 hypothetical protein [Hyphomicrobiales bacterium]